MSYRDILSKKLKAREEENSLRQLTVRDGLLDFFSNDYLGFARDPVLYNRIHVAEQGNKLSLYNGSTGSRLLSGNNKLAEQVEEELAVFFQSERTLIFNAGYNANVGVLSSIPQKGDTILYDELIHASIKDGARLSFATRISFRHNDVGDLERKVQKATGTVFIVIESIYSMDGDTAPLKEIVAIRTKYGACLIVDEAHSTGTVGTSGQGLVLAEGLQDEVDIRIHTFGKAMGIHGACVAGSALLIQYMVNFARSFIYTTAFSPHSFLSVREAFRYLQEQPDRIVLLNERIHLFQSAFKENNAYITSNSPIHVLRVESNDRVKQIATQIQDAGFDVRPILSPTVKKGEERIRFCLHAYNSIQEINDLISCTKQLV